MNEMRKVSETFMTTLSTTSRGPAPLIDLDIGSAVFHADPFAIYKRLRNETPVCRVILPGKLTMHLVTRYDDINTLLRDPRFVKKPANVPLAPGEPAPKEAWMPGFVKPLDNNMLDLDGADHDRLRGLVHLAFTPRMIEQLRAKAVDITQRLIDSALRAGDIDLVRDLALPLPVAIIADMLGVPEADRPRFARWSHMMIDNTGSPLEMLRVLPGLWQFMRFVRALIARHRAHPADDLTSAMIEARDSGQSLSEDEIAGMIVLLLIAGHETTVSLISTGMFALLTQPEARAQLQQDPALIKSAVEELLRYASPVAMATPRYAAEDVEIAGALIPKGALVFASLLSANHDERRFAQPELLNLAREDNRHLALGQGMHYCLGAPLARMEASIAFGALLARLPNHAVGCRA